MIRPVPHLLRTGEVARVFNCSPKTVTRWCRNGLLAVQRTPGSHCRIPVAAVRDALVGGGLSAAEADRRIATVLGQVGS